MNLDADIDSDIRAAIAKTSEPESSATPSEAIGAGVPGVDSGAGTDLAGDSDPTPAPGDAGAASSTLSASARARDDRGRFAPKSTDKTTAPEVAAQTQTKAAPTQAAPSSTGTQPPSAGGDSSTQPIRAPQALNAQEREHFAKAPPEIQRALVRIDQTARQALQESAPARRFVQEVSQVLDPIAKTRGISPGQLISSYAQADQMLSHPDPQTKAQAVARLMQSYGVSVEALDAVLSGQAPQQAQPQPPPINPDYIVEQAEQRLIQRMEKQRAQSELQSFMQSESAEHLRGEHAQRVLTKMLAAIQAEEAMGGRMSYQDAYEDAVWSVRETRAILEQRKAAEAANAQQASTQRARAASVSVKSQPAPAPNGAERDDLDSAIRAAMTSARRR